MRKYSKRLQTSFYTCPKRDGKFNGEMRGKPGRAMSSLMCRIWGLWIERSGAKQLAGVRRFRKHRSNCEYFSLTK